MYLRGTSQSLARGPFIVHHSLLREGKTCAAREDHLCLYQLTQEARAIHPTSYVPEDMHTELIRNLLVLRLRFARFGNCDTGHTV